MRKCITGHIGDPSFQEVLRLMEAGPPRSTLFIHNGSLEKAIHFSAEGSVLLELPLANPQPTQPPAGLDAARERLSCALAEAFLWEGAPFEYREGPAGEILLAHEGAMKLPASPALFGEALRNARGAWVSPRMGVVAFPAKDLKPSARLEELLKLIPGTFSKHIVLRELASVWKDLGAKRRAAGCLRDLARHYADWGAEENACVVLEDALDLCPADVGAAEDLMTLAQSAGRQPQAERAAEMICGELDRLRLHEQVVRFYRLLKRLPESGTLRRLAAEGMLKAGEVQQGMKELLAAATFLESRGDEDGAIRMYERIAEIDPTSVDAREKVRHARRHRAIVTRLRRSGTLIAATTLFLLWLSWDVSSASAYQSLKAAGMAMDRREAVDLLRKDSRSYPATRHAGRLASLEEDLYRQSFEEDKRNILGARLALDAGDLSTAGDLFDRVLHTTLLPVFETRARAGRAEIEKKRARVDDLIDQSARFVKARSFEKAFQVYRELLLGAHDAVLATSYSVPVWVETVPPGAALRLDGQEAGASPRWVFLPSDPRSKLVLSMRGFEPVEIGGALRPLLERNEYKLRVSFAPHRAWASESGGGELASNLGAHPAVAPVLGADGVLRGFDPQGSRKWEAPLDAGITASCPPVAAGPAVLLGTTRGNVLAFSLVSGKAVWAAKPCGSERGVLLGPVYAGDVLASSGGVAVLINPHTGLVARRILLPEGEPVRFQAGAGDIGLFVHADGDLTGANLRTGECRFTRKSLLKGATWVCVEPDAFFAGEKGGRVAAYSVKEASKVWETVLQGEYPAASAGLDGRLLLGSAAGSIVCLDAHTGQPAWKTTVEGAVTAISSPGDGEDGGTIIVHLDRGGDRAIAAISTLAGAAGKVLWELRTGPQETASVRIEKGRVLISTPSRGVVALKSPDA